MRLAALSSSSSGNSIYVGNDNTHILIDAGVSASTIEKGLNKLGLTLFDIDAILITHEHSDHIKGLGVIERKHEIPIYATQGTIEGIYESKSLGYFNTDVIKSIRELNSFNINDIAVSPHEISHDAYEPVCYSFETSGKKCAVVTDLGIYTDELINDLQNLNAILVESNHDVRMLEMGPYTYSLKKRILSDKGHLSNESCGRFVSKILNDSINTVMLGHLSDHNNMPELAYESVKLEITMADCKYNGNDFPVRIAKKSEISEIINF